jgi:hypothetical protein
MSIVPDAIEPYVGYKALIYADGDLYSPSHRVLWPKREKLEAVCAIYSGRPWDPPHDHEPGSTHCSCGIYAVDSPQACGVYVHSPASVICKVALWGTVTIGASGARGAYAYPQSIEYVMGLDNEQILRLADEYGLALPEGTPPDAAELIDSFITFMPVNTTWGPQTVWVTNMTTVNNVTWSWTTATTNQE